MLLDLLAAMECRQCVRIESSSSRGKNISFRVLLLKIYVSTQSGRRYVMCWFFKAHRIIFCRLDNLERVLEAKPVRDYDKFCAMAKQMEQHLWGVSMNRWLAADALEHVELVVRISSDEPYILQCLEREKRCGRVEKTDAEHYRFIADVHDAGEMLPWLRTFIGRIESFSCYNVVAKVLTQALDGKLSAASMQQLVCEGAYGDSVLQLLPALADGTWKLLTPELGTPLKNKPTMPLTALQKRWLKTLLLDEKISLFFSDEEIARQQAALQSVEPLCRPEQFVFFDRFVDGDAYTNPKYRVNFREILHAVREKRYLNASYRSNKGTIIVWTDLVPVSLEYSAKDDKFRLQAIAERKQVTLNLGRIISVEAGEAVEHVKSLKKGELAEQTLVLEIEDERSTMVRALMHFSDLAKETEKLDESHYLLTVQYDKSDETEMLFRVLSFGPTIKVREPEDFKELIRKSSENSCNAAQNFKCVCFFP